LEVVAEVEELAGKLVVEVSCALISLKLAFEVFGSSAGTCRC
jgi:hypothetical protein